MRRVASWVLWPLLTGAGCVATAWGLRLGVAGFFVVAAVYLGLALALGVLERVMPFEREWTDSDGQVVHDIVFNLAGSALPGQVANSVVLAFTVGLAQWLAHIGEGSPWPHGWPVCAQVALTVVVGDFGAYWGHRAFHNVAWLWPYHAVHHSVQRLWWLNAGRIHPLDAALMVAFSMPLLVMLGVPDGMVVWLLSITTIVSLLSHCNVDMRCGAFDWVFNTPGVHRWHHSRLLGESNNNYGETTMIWDVLFGTHYRQRRRPPRDIGTSTPIPGSIVGQFAEPLRLSWRTRRSSSAAAPDRADEIGSAVRLVDHDEMPCGRDSHVLRIEELGHLDLLSAPAMGAPASVGGDHHASHGR